jgi:hypothetical protein
MQALGKWKIACMNYRSLIEKNTVHLVETSDDNFLRLYDPADIKTIREVEGVIGIKLPEELAELYSQTDGASDEWFCFNIMRSDDLLEQNRRIRIDPLFTDHMSMNDLLVFSHSDGNMHFYAITPNGYKGIYEWNSITDERLWVANNLIDWIENQNA